MKNKKELVDLFKMPEIKTSINNPQPDTINNTQPDTIIEMGKSPYIDIFKKLTKNRSVFFVCFNLVVLCMIGGVSIINSFVYFCVALFGNIGAVTYIEVIDRVEKNKNKKIKK